MTEQLKKYEYAKLADKAYKDRGELALDAMSKLYEDLNVPEDDPVINRALAEARLGLSDGQITNSGIFEAIGVYAGKYNAEIKETKIKDFLDYVDYEDEIPENMKKLFDKYEDQTIGELSKDYENGNDNDNLSEEDKEKLAVLSAVNSLVEYRIESEVYPTLIEDKTKKNLENLISDINKIELAKRRKRELDELRIAA
ncbi:MAG: hypothetical protein PVG65_07190 [Candidatus Thorarchaeota archaeon]|jgi:hypothetical protein